MQAQPSHVSGVLVATSKSRGRWPFIGLLALAIFVGSSAANWAGMVTTVSEQREGGIQLQPSVVRVGSEAVPWAHIMFVANDAPDRTSVFPHAVRLKNGEVWTGTITAISRTSVTLESATLGTKPFAIEQLSAIDFAPRLGDLGSEKSRSLHRLSGKPLSGTILWLKGDRLAIDTPIGAIELKASGLKRYVCDKDPAAAPLVLDEIRLTDGSVLRGSIEPAQDAMVVQHPLFGKHTFGPQAWSSVRRFSGPAVYLSDLQPVKEKMVPLIRRPADRPRSEFAQSKKTGPASRLVISPKTVLEYKVPGTIGEKYLLTAGAQLSDGSRGSARLGIRIGEEVLLDKVLTPAENKPFAFSYEVPVGSSLEITVDFHDRVHFPCSVSIDNALLLKK